MKRPRLIIGILAGLHVVLATLILGRYETMEARYSGLLDLSLLMLLISQGNLLGLWTALGGKRTPWRVTFTVVGIVVCLVVCDSFRYQNQAGEAVLLFVWQTMTVSVLLLLARMMGLKLIHAGCERVEQELGRFQFSLWQMLTWTTVLAVILSAIHYLPYGLQPNFRFNPMLARLAASFGGVAVASMWLAFGRRWLAARVIVLAATIGLGAAMMDSTRGPSATSPSFGLLLLAEAAWTTGSLLVVRAAGYRLTWH